MTTTRAGRSAPPNSEGQDLKGGPLLTDGAAHHVALVRDIAAGDAESLRRRRSSRLAPLNAGRPGRLSNSDGEADDVYIGNFRRCGRRVRLRRALIQPLAGSRRRRHLLEPRGERSELAAIHGAGPNALTTDVTAPAVLGELARDRSSRDDQRRLHGGRPAGSGAARARPVRCRDGRPLREGPGRRRADEGRDRSGRGVRQLRVSRRRLAGTYEFATVATDAAGNAEALPAHGRRQDGRVGASRRRRPRPTPRRHGRYASTAVEQAIVGLPSTRQLRQPPLVLDPRQAPRGVKLTSATVFVDGGRSPCGAASKLTAPVNLKGLPKGRYSVRIVLVLASGKQVTGTRRYRTCTPEASAP